MVKINTTLRPIWFPWDLGCCLIFRPRLRLGRKLNNNLGPKEIIYRPRVVLYSSQRMETIWDPAEYCCCRLWCAGRYLPCFSRCLAVAGGRVWPQWRCRSWPRVAVDAVRCSASRNWPPPCHHTYHRYTVSTWQRLSSGQWNIGTFNN